MSINQVQKVQVFPQNRSSNNNVWSYESGNPLLVFNIASEEKYLMTNTLRLNFKLQLRTNTAGLPENQYGTEVRLDPKIGAASLFQEIEVSNSRNDTLEQVKYYPRLVASLLGSTSGWGNYTTNLQQSFAATSNSEASGRIQNRKQQCSMPLLCAMFMSNSDTNGMLPLGPDHINGIRLVLRLSPSINSNYGTTAGSANGSYYELSDVSLTYSAAVPEGNMLPKMKSIPLTAYSSYYNVLNNSDETLTIPTSLGQVLSTTSNFVPTEHISNYSHNENLTNRLLNKNAGGDYDDTAPIRNYDTLVAGLKKPYQFSQSSVRNVVQNAAGTYTNSIYEAQRERYYLNSLSSFNNIKDTLAGGISEGLQSAVGDDGNFNDRDANVFGVGARFNGALTSNGANMKGRPFTHRIRSTLNGSSPNSIYTYMLHRSVLILGGNGSATTVE